MAATIKDIAARVGLSSQAVSYALRGENRIAEGTRLRVLHAAKELGYRPHAFARATRNGRFGVIGLLLSSENRHSYLPHQLLTGIDHEVASAEMQLTLGRLPDRKLVSQGFVPALLRSWSADGLLINYQESIPPKMIEQIEGDLVPAVWINTKRDASCVYIDDIAAGRRATEELLCRGHKRVAYVDYSHGTEDGDTAHYSSVDREQGYRQAMAAAGLAPQVIRGRNVCTGEERNSMSAALLADPLRPTAVVAYGGSTSIPIALAAMLQGLSLPRDLSLVSIDNDPTSTLGYPFGTVILPLQDLGGRAVRKLLARIAGGTVGAEAVVPEHFEPGATVGPPSVGK